MAVSDFIARIHRFLHEAGSRPAPMSIYLTALFACLVVSRTAHSSAHQVSEINDTNTTPEARLTVSERPSLDFATFDRYLQTVRSRERQDVERTANISEQNFQVAMGGWHGSGGGGGIACYGSRQQMQQALGPDGIITKENIATIPYFQILDVSDRHWNFSFPTDKDPYEFFEKRITDRLGTSLPILANYLISQFRAVRNLPVREEPFLSAHADVGRFVAGGMRISGCAYAQWMMRYHLDGKTEPNYYLAINSTLDKHLRRIMSPVMYRLQRALLELHEAFYAVFTKVEDESGSAPTRAMMDLLLLPEDYFKENLKNSDVDAAYWSVWLREGLPALLQAWDQYTRFLLTESKVSDSTQQRWDAYREFVRITDWSTRAHGPGGANKPPVQIGMIEGASPLYPLHQDLLFNFLFPSFASDVDPGPDDRRIRPAHAFFLLAAVLEARRIVAPVQLLVLEDPTNSREWRRACREIATLENGWRTMADPDDIPLKNMLGVRRWISARAKRYCDELGIPMSAQEAK